MSRIRQGKGQTTENPDRHKAEEKGKTPGGEQGRPRARRREHRVTSRNSVAFTASQQGSSTGPAAGLNSEIRALQSERWQELKWEKVEAAEVALVGTSIFTLAGRQVSRGFE